jgi:hypothetical protein
MADAPAVGAIKEAEVSLPVVEEPKFIEFYSGEMLTSSAAETITLSSRTHLVVFAGAVDSGKTTIVSSIYEELNQGPFASFQFAGSRTLLGFEQICHYNRVASGGTKPETPRTATSEEATFYHLALKDLQNGNPRRHVLISAMAGELYRMATDSRDDAARLKYMRRADTLVILIDGGRLSALDQRVNAQAEAGNLLESLIDAQVISPDCKIEFVFSKLDLINAKGQEALDFVSKTEAKFRSRFQRLGWNPGFRRIAARPDPLNVASSLETGLADAFTSWVQIKDKQLQPIPTQAPEQIDREFNRFGWRQKAQDRGEE